MTGFIKPFSIGFPLLAVLALAIGVSGSRAEAQSVPRAIPVKNVDEPGRRPYQVSQSSSCSGSTGTVCDFSFPPIPAGKLVVIEYINGSYNYDPVPGELLPQMPLLDFYLCHFLSGCTTRTAILPLTAAEFGNQPVRIVSERVKWYADEASTPTVRIEGLSNAVIRRVYGSFTLSGYVIDKTL